MNSPNCIHLPSLVRGYPAKIHWGPVSGAEGYVLERRLAGESGEFTGGFSPVFQGMPPMVDYLHRGMSWQEIRAAAASYTRIRELACQWRRVSRLGKGKWEKDAQYADRFPDDAELIQYRVKAVGGGEESAYKKSGITKVHDHAPADDDLELAVKAGEIVYLVVAAEAVQFFPTEMTLYYDPAQLRLLELKGNIDPNPFMTDGMAEFSFGREVPEDMAFTGLVALGKLEAKVSGSVQIQMS